MGQLCEAEPQAEFELLLLAPLDLGQPQLGF
jgi:hypothetical protein